MIVDPLIKKAALIRLNTLNALYKSDVGNGLTENEFDHVFIGVSNQNPTPNPAEVSDWTWVTTEELEQQLVRNPEKYSPWLRRCFSEVIKYRLRELRGDLTPKQKHSHLETCTITE